MSNAKRTPSNNTDPSSDSKPGKPKYNPGSLTWVSCNLNDSDKRWLSDNSDYIHEFIFKLVAALGHGYTISSKYDDKSQRWLTTVICSDESLPSHNCALSSRGKTREISFFILAYFHLIKLADGWGASANDDDDWS